MKRLDGKKVFGIRKLKVGVCSILLAVSFVGAQNVLAEEVAPSTQSTTEENKLVTTETSPEKVQKDNQLETTVENAIPKENVETPKKADAGEKVEEVNKDTNDEKINAPAIALHSVSERSANGVEAAQPTTDTLNVKDFGAVGDGVTDDHEAMQAAIDAASQGLGGGKLYFPEGTYLVKKMVQLKSNIDIRLHDDATIVNGINFQGRPSIVFMTGPFINGGDKIFWEPTENISFTGGTIDMNGALNEEGTKPKNLPFINSSGGFAIGNSSNVTIRNVTFKDSYQGHAIQIAGSKNVLVDQSRFLGQALPKTIKDNAMITKESIQIEPMTRKGFPYALNETGVKSENVTIQNSYFGKSDKSGELVTAIGTHYQAVTTQNPSNIKILNNHFDNLVYSGIRFTGFTDIVIKDNVFDKKTKEESVRYREDGGALVNAFSYKNTEDVLDLNKKVVITNNRFNIKDPKTQAIRVARDSEEYLGKVKDIEVTNNIINNQAQDSEVPSIELLRISDGLTVSGNVINGGKDGIVINNSTGSITAIDNFFSNLTGNSISLLNTGDYGNISVVALGLGNADIHTENVNYHVIARNKNGYYYLATYSDDQSANLINKVGEVIIPIAQGERFERYIQYEFRKVSEEGKKSDTPAKEALVQAEANRNQKELPQTGTNSYLGAIASLVGLGVFFGVGGVKKRHEN
ncbi:glycosyl hydrolase family 28-related protein [uncultured Granulicatella sp.]|uniref:glycosyl hydrolase family 28-related protein n=1 Tax=uncultured Granulicatella sp. TaxID=316089 RepID=UPI00261189D3|nr:glycosyl hydrolase family 28-related protein [uncultured Granulicatella sp.]